MTSTTDPARLELYWIPLGAGARVVRISGRVYEAIASRLTRRPRCDLYHSALVAVIGETSVFVEMAPEFDDRGHADRGVVARGAVGSRWLGRSRLFRYEVRRWRDGVIPDLGFAVGSPVLISNDPALVQDVLETIASVPTPVWGRDELRAGEMWNSNSVISWSLETAGVANCAGSPPNRGRAPGWDAGLVVARRGTARRACSCPGRAG